MEDNTGSRESKKKSMEDNTRSSESKEKGTWKSMEDNTRPGKNLSNYLVSPKQTSSPRFRKRAAAISHISFFKKAKRRKPREMINHHVGATGTSQSVPGQNIVLVRPRTSAQTNPQVPMEGDDEIFEEEAVCKKCFHNLKGENILKTECKCGNALIHEECADEWSRTRGNNNCDSCGQEVQTFPVTLVRGLSSSTQVVDKEESNKWSLFSWLMRIWKA